MKHLFIINPKAGKGKALKLIPEIEEEFKNTNEEFLIEITEKVGHATEIVRKYVSKENYRVYAVGGDGTLNEVLNGMINSESCLGFIPSGSGNDFIRSVYKGKLPRNIIKDTVNGKIKPIDLAKVDDRYFINISSIGIDAEVANNARNIKKRPFISGKIAYILSAIITILMYKYREIQLIIDNKEIKIKNTLLALANGRYYGGGMKVAPDADLQDGLLDICAIDKLSRAKMFILFPKLIKGEHHQIEEVTFYKGKKVIVNSEEEVTLNIDGEIVKRKNVTFEIVPGGVKFIIP
ncbi:diacylglycerol kinase family lipid kinase [Clostridium sp. OS1-26]|uniref:diacylglycerol/lipid kinase family protein n=1 Tax=Clostridium sp. OS1-26 TaxID=3070681 RepID=UPI0027E093B3|nr:diacylglycerol kinase family lipid kinase [Clostridium sp. OS1-26]WML34565.1 diacylglycerol kinase family lipid kinase [Clostridium sp. OS1-26]